MKFFFTILGISFWLNGSTQYVNLPDSNFRNYINTLFGCIDNQGRLDTNCVTILNANNLYLDGNLTIRNIDGIQYFKNLEFLSISNTKIKNIDFLPQSLKYLNCNNDTDLILSTLPENLIHLDCSFCNLDTLPIMPSGLLELNIENNRIKKLPFLGDSLVWFSCKNNLIDSILTLPNTLRRFNCDTNRIVFISKLPDSLFELNCNFNKIKYLPIINDKLLYCSTASNLLTSIDVYQSNLKILNCSNNPTGGNWKLNNSLKEFTCRNNLLNKIENLPLNLENLFCSDNSIDTLIELKYFKMLDCHNNQIKYLHFNTDSLLYLDCSNNNITELQDVIRPKDILLGYKIFNNPSLKCFPLLNVEMVNYGVYFQNTQINCVPYKTKYPQGDLRNIPLCNPTNNPNNCNSFPVIQSFTYTDLNNNGKYDANEFSRKSIKVSLINNFSYTNPQGTAYLNADSLGTYTITAQAPPLYTAVPASYTHTFNRYDTIVYDTFALQPLVTKDSLSIDITPFNWVARPGFNYAYKIDFENVGTTILNPIVNIILDTSKYIFDSTSNNAIAFSGNSVTYNFNNFVPGQTGGFYIYGKLKTTATLGSSLQSIATINANNAFAADTVNTNIRGSYDPNDKQATPALSVQQVGDNAHYIDYTIRFQNTGNDTAFTVVVSDTLNPNNVQVNTITNIQSSHSVKPTQKDNIIFFEFRNINLPDSNTNKVASNGFISFKIKPKTNLTNGSVVPNNAAIYFDYNTPIITNTANTLIGALPLKLLSFGAMVKPENKTVLAYWNTANELNTSHFIIEKSNDCRSFKPLTDLAAKGIGDNSYYSSLSQESVFGNNATTVFLRLKMIDKDGKFSYSNIVKLTNNEKQEKLVILSPAKNELKIIVKTNEFNNTKASVINAQGKLVKEFVLQQGNMSIDISALAKGVYYLSTQNGNYKFVVE